MFISKVILKVDTLILNKMKTISSTNKCQEWDK